MGLFSSSSSEPSSSGQSTSKSQPAPRSQPPTKTKPPPTVPQKATNGTPRSLSDLTPNTLYLLLFLRVNEGEYHWDLYLHHDEGAGGMKYHITNPSSENKWHTDHAMTRGVFKSFLLVGLLELIKLDSDARLRAIPVIEADDGRLNDIPGLTCRTWVLRVLERLRAGGFLTFPSVAAVEQEALSFGYANSESARNARQPRPLEVSKLCR